MGYIELIPKNVKLKLHSLNRQERVSLNADIPVDTVRRLYRDTQANLKKRASRSAGPDLPFLRALQSFEIGSHYGRKKFDWSLEHLPTLIGTDPLVVLSPDQLGGLHGLGGIQTSGLGRRSPIFAFMTDMICPKEATRRVTAIANTLCQAHGLDVMWDGRTSFLMEPNPVRSGIRYSIAKLRRKTDGLVEYLKPVDFEVIAHDPLFLAITKEAQSLSVIATPKDGADVAPEDRAPPLASERFSVELVTKRGALQAAREFARQYLRVRFASRVVRP